MILPYLHDVEKASAFTNNTIVKHDFKWKGISHSGVFEEYGGEAYSIHLLILDLRLGDDFSFPVYLFGWP